MSDTTDPAQRPSKDEVIPGFGPDRMDQYERGTSQRGPRELLLRALDLPRCRPGSALDLGCGVGMEAELLLRRGWRVTATDASARMLAATRERAEAAGGLDRLETIHAPFERTQPPRDAFDLVHAGFSLPFCPSQHFEALWERLLRSLRSGGIFVGQLFGPDDEFVRTSPAGAMTAHGMDDLPRLFERCRIIHHEQVNRAGHTAPGTPKHWHVHHLIAQRD